LAVLLGFVEGELEEWAKQDAVEDKQFGDLRGYDQLKDKSKRSVQKKAAQHYVKQIKEKVDRHKSEIEDRLKAAQQEVDASELKKVSTTDPESRFMMNKKGKIELAYNPQLTVDRNGFVLANDVFQDAFDTDQLQPHVLQTESNIGDLPAGVRWSFDAGYYESENLKILADKKIDGYVYCQEKAEDTPYDKKYFHYDAEKDEYLCPEKGSVIFVGTTYDKLKNKTARFYKGTQCVHCGAKKECTKSRTGFRRIRYSLTKTSVMP